MYSKDSGSDSVRPLSRAASTTAAASGCSDTRSALALGLLFLFWPLTGRSAPPQPFQVVEATIEEIIEAATIAGVNDFINQLPMGYDTILSQGGFNLSGGQRQRLAIARAILHRPRILIFDEATSSLDTISERLVQDAIERISKDRTVIVIAHRISTIRHADKIVVLDGGRIVEEGTHEELVSGQGQYFHLVSSSL